MFPDMQFSQNHIANYGPSFKAQKVMLPSLKYQIFPFGPNLSRLPNYLGLLRSRIGQIRFSKIQLCHFLVYMAQYPYAKN